MHILCTSNQNSLIQVMEECRMTILQLKIDKGHIYYLYSEGIFFNRATKFLVIKNPLNKVVSVFLFDHFSELGFETIVDGAQRGTFREKLFSWFNAVMVNSV